MYFPINNSDVGILKFGFFIFGKIIFGNLKFTTSSFRIFNSRHLFISAFLAFGKNIVEQAIPTQKSPISASRGRKFYFGFLKIISIILEQLAGFTEFSSFVCL